MVSAAPTVRLIKPFKIAAVRFQRDNHGANAALPYPWKDHTSPFVHQLLPGWKVIGYARNSDIDPAVRRREDQVDTYIAVMLSDPEGFEIWFHMTNYEHRFIES